MLTATTLGLLADAGESHAEDPGLDSQRANALRVAASDARMTASAGSGYGTPETLALAIVVDNDRKLAEHRSGLVRSVWESDSETKTADLADALSAWIEHTAGFEGMVVLGPTSQLGAKPADQTWGGSGYQMPDVTAALARAAFRNVDWIGWARHYLNEAALGNL